MSTEFTTPIGRLVLGSLYNPQTTDMDGNPLVTKTGPNAGQPRVNYFFALAIPKKGEQHWAHTEWGAIIYNTGATAFPSACQTPAFAWKITDGDDSRDFNARGQERKVKPCDREGYPGHWVLSFSSTIKPQTFTMLGTNNKVVDLPQENAINAGDYIQVNGTTSGNGNANNPGIYINPRYICLMGYGERIILGRDPNEVGFGGDLPAGASTTPVAKATIATAMTTINQPIAVPPVPVVTPTPYTQILNPSNVPAATAAVAMVPPPPPPVMNVPPPAPVKTLKIHPQYNPEGKLTYDMFIGWGWNDETMKQHGLI